MKNEECGKYIMKIPNLNKIKAWYNINRPVAAARDGWTDWKINAKAEKPIPYFLQETLPEFGSDVWYYTCLPYKSSRQWLRYNIFERKHVVNTGLKPGYYDGDTRLLHASFNLLVDFVEIEKAWMDIRSDADKKKKEPWWSLNPTRFKSHRNPEAGIAYLNWEMKLTRTSPQQARAAREIYKLYKWWKDVRPNRPEPLDASGWTAVCNELENSGGVFSERAELSLGTEFQKRKKAALKKLRKIEEKYEKEDEEMLIRLIKIRQHLWT